MDTLANGMTCKDFSESAPSPIPEPKVVNKSKSKKGVLSGFGFGGNKKSDAAKTAAVVVEEEATPPPGDGKKSCFVIRKDNGIPCKCDNSETEKNKYIKMDLLTYKHKYDPDIEFVISKRFLESTCDNDEDCKEQAEFIVCMTDKFQQISGAEITNILKSFRFHKPSELFKRLNALNRQREISRY